MTAIDRTSAPSPRSLATTGAAAALVGAALALLPVSTPPPDPAALGPWWSTVGTAHATISLLRIAGLIAAAWLIVIAASGLAVEATGSVAAARVWRLVTPGAVRRAMLATAVTVGSTVAVAGAAEAPEPAPVLRDLGPAPSADDSGPVLRDLGPVNANPVARPVVDAAPADTWTVARGDHLWRIAEETLADRGHPTDDAAVSRYWRELIERNRDTIGTDPDLIHPGAVLVLP